MVVVVVVVMVVVVMVVVVVVMVMTTVLNTLHFGGRLHPQSRRIVGPKQGDRVRNRLQQVPVVC
jgi:hypothetical protein